MNRKLSARLIPAELGVKRGDVVTTRERLPEPGKEAAGWRKVYLVLGPSRNPARVRVCSWAPTSSSWNMTVTIHPNELAPAPASWPETIAVKEWLKDNRIP